MQRQLRAIWESILDGPGRTLTGPDWILSAEKRRLDLLMASMLLPLYGPVSVAGALLMLCTDGKAPFFSQQRVGKDGVLITEYRIRTMRDTLGVDASCGSADPRATRPGKVLRKFTVDQFPELLNVFQGTMTMAAPRPLLPYCRQLTRDALSSSEGEEWEWATTLGRPGMYSTFGNASVGLDLRAKKSLRLRAKCDVEDVRMASLKRDLETIGDVAKIGLSFVSRRA